MIWTEETLSDALGITINTRFTTGVVQFNSKNVQIGDLFIAIDKGDGDGHDYVIDALIAGASIAIVNKFIKGVPTNKLVLVSDTFESLKKMASYKRKISKAKFIAITGSVGKTSTKEAMKIMLQNFGKTFASRGNFNNYLGVLINLASIQDSDQYVIIEVGMNHRGEIRELSKKVKPDIAIITSISEAHFEFFNSIHEIADAKCEIFENLDVRDGIAIINCDCNYKDRIIQNLKALKIENEKIFSFGFNKNANARILLYEQLESFVNLTISLDGIVVTLRLPLLAKQYSRNFAISLMVAKILDLNIYKAANSLTSFCLLDGRGKIVNAKISHKKCKLICDHYNANPESFIASLEYLKCINHKKKFAILADMLELGKKKIESHRSLIPYIINSQVQKAIVIGYNMYCVYEALKDTMIIAHFFSSNLSINQLNDFVEDDSLILIKGSRAMQLEKIIQKFKV